MELTWSDCNFLMWTFRSEKAQFIFTSFLVSPLFSYGNCVIIHGYSEYIITGQ